MFRASHQLLICLIWRHSQYGSGYCAEMMRKEKSLDLIFSWISWNLYGFFRLHGWVEFPWIHFLGFLWISVDYSPKCTLDDFSWICTFSFFWISRFLWIV